MKYSRLLIEEAIALSKEVGLPEAAKITGINRYTLNWWRSKLRVLAGYKAPYRRETKIKYSIETRRKIVVLVDQYRDTGYARSKMAAYIMAGKKLNLNGMYFYNLQTSGLLFSPAIQQFRKDSKPRCSMNTANPQAKL